MDRAYDNGTFFEILINRALHTSSERYPQLSNLIHSEDGMSFSGFGSREKHLEKTKKLLIRALKALSSNKIVAKDIKTELKDMILLTEEASTSEAIYNIVTDALELTRQYKEVL
jgi:hypothetical protein